MDERSSRVSIGWCRNASIKANNVDVEYENMDEIEREDARMSSVSLHEGRLSGWISTGKINTYLEKVAMRPPAPSPCSRKSNQPISLVITP